MKVTQLKDKKIAIVGLGLTGRSCARYLLRNDIVPIGFDTRTQFKTALNIETHFGPLAENALVSFDLIILSPGLSSQIPAIQTAIAKGIPVVGDIELFAANCTKPIIGITGSNGKSTVVSMLAAVFEKADFAAVIGGNIGVPALDLLDHHFDVAVLELSSFQLETVSSLNLRVAALLNLSEDHMDRYPDLPAYRMAKQRIFDNAQFKLANLNDQNTLPLGSVADACISSDSRFSGFGINYSPLEITLNGESFIDPSSLKVSGLHNLLNIQATAIIAMEMGVQEEVIVTALTEYNGLAHRCQKVSNFNNVVWINDSKATNVGATIAAIQGLKPMVRGNLWLVAGGDAKNADLSPLHEYLQNDVDQLITIGKDASRFAEICPRCLSACTLEDAVQLAASGTRAGDMVLLSPACASLDMFRNFEQRGDVFIKAVEALK